MRIAVILLALVAAGGSLGPSASAQVEPSPSELIRQLKRGATPELRLAAIRSRPGWSVLTDALRDPDVRVRRAAVEAYLGRFEYASYWGDREGCLVLLDAAHDADPALRLAALRHLDIGAGALPVALLLARAKGETDDPEQRIAAEWIRLCLQRLGQAGDPEKEERSTEPRGENRGLRADRVRKLIDYADSWQPGVPGLLERLRDPDPGVRRWAVGFIRTAAVCGCKPGHYDLRPEHFRAVVDALRDADVEVRKAAADALVNAHGRHRGWVPVEAAIRASTGMLSDPDESARAMAVRALCRLDRSGESRERLCLLLRDRSPAVRRAAVRALGQSATGDAATVQAILPLLEDREAEVREDAIAALADLGPAALPAASRLLALLRDPAERQKHGWNALDALGKIGLPDVEALRLVLALVRDEELDWPAQQVVSSLGPGQAWSVPSLCGLLADPTSQAALRRAVLRALTRMGPPARAALPVVRSLLGSEHPSEFRLRALAAVYALEGWGKPPLAEFLALADGDIPDDLSEPAGGTLWQDDVRQLVAALDDPRTGVRAWAASRIGRLRREPEVAVPALARMLADPGESVAGCAAFALEAFGSAAAPAVPALAHTLERCGDKDLRGYVLRTLAAIGPAAAPAAPVLVRCLVDPDLPSWDVAEPLAAIGAGSLEALRFLQRTAPESVRERVTALLGRIGEPALPDLILALGDPHPTVRARAAWIIASLGSCASGSAKRLAGLLGDEYAFVRFAAACVLGRIAPDPDGVVPPLIEATRDDYGFVRVEAVCALGSLGAGAEPAVPRLVEMLTTDWEHLRFAAARALRRIGAPARSALPALEAARATGSPAVRLAAERAIAAIRP